MLKTCVIFERQLFLARARVERGEREAIEDGVWRQVSKSGSKNRLKRKRTHRRVGPRQHNKQAQGLEPNNETAESKIRRRDARLSACDRSEKGETRRRSTRLSTCAQSKEARRARPERKHPGNTLSGRVLTRKRREGSAIAGED